VKGKAAIMAGPETILQELHVLIETLAVRVDALDVQCRERASALSLAQLLMTMPGVGVITALTVIAEVADFTQFPSAKKLVGYAGLAPRQRSSGGHIRMGGITHEGSRILRSTLVETAMRVHPKSAPELYAMVERLTLVCGAKRARVALARKLLTILWKMGTTQMPYDPRRVSSVCLTTVSKPDTCSGA
jgi:transposase